MENSKENYVRTANLRRSVVAKDSFAYMQWDASDKGTKEMLSFLGSVGIEPEFFTSMTPRQRVRYRMLIEDMGLVIENIAEGSQHVTVGDYVIRTCDDRYFVCKPQLFNFLFKDTQVLKEAGEKTFKSLTGNLDVAVNSLQTSDYKYKGTK